MDFQFSDEQKRIVETVDEMGRKQFAAKASRWDENHEYPWQNIELLHEANILGMTIPTEAARKDPSLMRFWQLKLPQSIVGFRPASLLRPTWAPWVA